VYIVVYLPQYVWRIFSLCIYIYIYKLLSKWMLKWNVTIKKKKKNTKTIGIFTLRQNITERFWPTFYYFTQNLIWNCMLIILNIVCECLIIHSDQMWFVGESSRFVLHVHNLKRPCDKALADEPNQFSHLNLQY
jgi:hypothetical protein